MGGKLAVEAPREVGLAAAAVDGHHARQFVRIGDRQRPQRQRVEQREHRGGRADRERQDHDGGAGEDGRPCQRAEGVTHVPHLC
jgi:hypothetical protein